MCRKLVENLLQILRKFSKKFEKFHKIFFNFWLFCKKYYIFRINKKFYSVLTKLCKNNWRNFENFESFKKILKVFKKILKFFKKNLKFLKILINI